MTAPIDLHQALQSLSPIDESSIPSDQPTLQPFLESTFTTAAYVIDTLPIPPPAPVNFKSLPVASSSSPSSSTTNSPAGGRSRSTTVSSAVSGNTSLSTSSSATKLTIVPSSIRPKEPEIPSVFTKEWKEVKPGGNNPHDIKVYKLSSKDGGGAWFARRSVHEGIGFARFRKGLRREFEESLERRMGVGREGSGNGNNNNNGEEMVIPAGVRGIGAERRLERRVVKGVGRVDVYHLSAQFPGPSAPRDFVTACITSSSSAPPRTSTATATKSGKQGREFTMVSRPLSHSSAPEQTGFVRGKYESIEFIREIIPATEEEEESAPRRSMSVSDLTQRASVLLSVEDASRPVGRKRSRTVGETPRKAVSFDESSTPINGNVMPRTGTFGSDPLKGHRASRLREAISADDLPEDEEGKVPSADIAEQKVKNTSGGSVAVEEGDMDSLEGDGETNPVEWIMLTRSDPGGSVPRFMVERGTPGSIVKDAEKFLDWACEKVHEEDVSDDEHEPEEEEEEEIHPDQDSFNTFSTGSTVEGGPLVNGSHETEELRRAMSHDDSMSNLSFRTADSGECEEDEEEDEGSSSLESSQLNGGQLNPLLVDEIASGRARAGTEASSSSSSAALQRIQTDALKTAAKTQNTRDKNDKKMAVRLAKEEEKQRKLEAKHAREAAKREEKFQREQAKAEEKRRKEEEKIRDRKRRLEERDEKLRNEREREDLRREVELLRKERDVLNRENEALRKEAAGLRARYELEGGHPGLKSRSSSSMALHSHQVQRPASPASSSTSSKGKKNQRKDHA
ncbi:hypothetical protein TWF192_001590 [Orbilia oligospora]|uniref:DUF3074 domain-containing protein n=1 Tax=Orbilia oligospora TaxID=2813651 RepID=A0A6G1LVI2_ORBOL|nr:hypothetical protein TWF679_003784 [Orbilia oligospora]KAF3234253.1 hypothetical protein TWF192_001590 [Orbilia oligospora]